MRQVDESCEGIPFCDVINLLPKSRAVIIKTHNRGYATQRFLGVAFDRFKFEAIRWVKTRPKPEDRIWMFETLDSDGHYDIPKEQALIRARLTREERNQLEKEEQELRILAREHGVDWDKIQDKL